MSYTKLMYHIVFSTRDRRPDLTPETLPRICEYMGGIIRKTGGKMLSANGTADPVHIATIGSPRVSVPRPPREARDRVRRAHHLAVTLCRPFGTWWGWRPDPAAEAAG